MKLKKCPFCGKAKAKADKYENIHEDSTPPFGFSVVCDAQKSGCGASTGWKKTIEEAVKSWNERSK